MLWKNSRAISKPVTQADLPIWAEDEIENKKRNLVLQHRQLNRDLDQIEHELLAGERWELFILPSFGIVPPNREALERIPLGDLESIHQECLGFLQGSLAETGTIGLLIEKGIFLRHINVYLQKKMLGEDCRRTLAHLDRKYTGTSLENDFRDWIQRINTDFFLAKDEFSLDFTQLNRTIYRRLSLFLRRRELDRLYAYDPIIFFGLLPRVLRNVPQPEEEDNAGEN
jgi:hypothetical protein